MVCYCVIITPANAPLRRISYMSGLEAIKRMLGVTRSKDTTGITVFDVTWLWHEYEHGRGDTLPLLLKYNPLEVWRISKTIIELAHQEFAEEVFSADRWCASLMPARRNCWPSMPN